MFQWFYQELPPPPPEPPPENPPPPEKLPPEKLEYESLDEGLDVIAFAEVLIR